MVYSRANWFCFPLSNSCSLSARSSLESFANYRKKAWVKAPQHTDEYVRIFVVHLHSRGQSHKPKGPKTTSPSYPYKMGLTWPGN